MTHQYIVSTAAAARLLLGAARVSSKAVALIADVIEGRLDVDSISWDEFGDEGATLGADLRLAIRRSQRARQAARTRRSATSPSPSDTPETTAAESVEVPVDVPSEMRRTSRGLEKFFRWPDRSWRRTPPTPTDIDRFGRSRKRRR